jgi:predicted amidohydrolase YtcJ
MLMCQVCIGNVFGSIGGLRPGFTRREFFAATAGTLALAPSLPAFAATSQGADTIFHGGPIIPMAGAQQYAEALAVADGKIVAVGGNDEIMGLKSASTRIVNLDGRTMLPGFIDAHQHTVTGALITAIFTDVGYTKYKSRKAVLTALRAKADKTPPGEWLLFTGFDNLLQGGDFSMTELDSVSKAHPILVYYINMHTACGNSTAFTAARIPDDIGDLPGGGHFGRDAAGKLDGLIYEETALKKFAVAIPKITPEFAGNAVIDWLKINASVGNTAIHEAGVLVFGDLLQGYERVAAQSPCRASISLMFDSMKEAAPYKKLGQGARATQIPDTLLSIYAMKIVGDGSNQTKSAAQTVPYLTGAGMGKTNYSGDEMKAMVAAVKAEGWPVSIHANGDAALDNALEAIEAVYGANPATGVNRIEHCTITRPEQIERMAKLGVQPSFLMNHVYFYGAAYRDLLFGPERASRMDPAGECVKLGLPFTLHTDAPCSNIGTLQLIQTAVTRRCSVDGSVVGAEQAVSLTEAIKAVTVYAAGQIGMHDRLGTLEAGKEADLTILEDDLYKVDPDKIMGVKVSETWVGGRKMHAA